MGLYGFSSPEVHECPLASPCGFSVLRSEKGGVYPLLLQQQSHEERIQTEAEF